MYLFIETRAFSKRVEQNGLEEALHRLQLALIADPTAGDLDPGTGGLRKVRMPNPRRGKGKRGGARVHYLWLPKWKVFYLVFLYTKDEQDSLTKEQKVKLKAVVREIEREADRRAKDE